MNALKSTTDYRQKALDYMKPILCSNSYIWVNNVFSVINKRVLTRKDDKFEANAILFYTNLVDFLDKHVTDISSGKVLLTVYTCAIELGVCELGDEVETYMDFKEEVDMDDWRQMTVETIKNFDMVITTKLMQNVYANEKYEIIGGGLLSLNTVALMHN